MIVSTPLRDAALNGVLSALLNAVTWIFRRWGGSLIHDNLLGVNGFPLAGRCEVSMQPKHIGVDFYEFRELPEAVVRHTLESRNRHVVGFLDALTHLLSERVFAADDALPILARIANDTTLIHASYYQHDACREQIAAWLARDFNALSDEAYESQLF